MISAPLAVAAVTSDWTSGLPLLTGSTFSLRELRIEDADSLCSLLTRDEVSRFMSRPPSSVAEFRDFIRWIRDQQRAGRYVCFAIVPDGLHTAVGIFQLRALERGFATAEWGFTIGSQFWGSGIFLEGARLVLDFAFDVMGVNRLEARAAVANGRGNSALRKIGAVQEGVLRSAFMREGMRHDLVLWGILADDWRLQRLPQEATRIS